MLNKKFLVLSALVATFVGGSLSGEAFAYERTPEMYKNLNTAPGEYDLKGGQGEDYKGTPGKKMTQDLKMAPEEEAMVQ